MSLAGCMKPYRSRKIQFHDLCPHGLLLTSTPGVRLLCFQLCDYLNRTPEKFICARDAKFSTFYCHHLSSLIKLCLLCESRLGDGGNSSKKLIKERTKEKSRLERRRFF